MKTNAQIEREVQDAILREPLLRRTEIGVMAKDGVVTLTGMLESYARKLAAENAVKNVAGVKAIIEEIRVSVSGADQKTDTEIAADILHALTWNIDVPEEKVKVIVENGWVTLEGHLEFAVQREAVKKVVNHLPGIKGVRNNIRIKSEKEDAVEKAEIEKALAGNTLFENDQINVKVNHHDVTLTGAVQSLLEKDIAEQIAWKAQGVSRVTNELQIQG
jgi:osmotically-inducible protein OsmY